MRSHALIHFTRRIHYCDASMNKIQCYVKDVITKKELWLSFTKEHFLYNRILNSSNGYIEPFTIFITYNSDYKNRVRLMTDKQYIEFERKFPEYII